MHFESVKTAVVAAAAASYQVFYEIPLVLSPVSRRFAQEINFLTEIDETATSIDL